MDESEVLAYVKAAAQAVNLPLDEARAGAVAAHLGRTLGMARLLDGADLAPENELAEIYRPAPFPAAAQPEDLA
jgi:1-carboxybiuret hydrolase subunit AtzG-like protein